MPTTIITGASAGIGAALAERLAREGHDLALVARREAPLADVAARCGDRALALVADATSRAEMERVVAATIARFGTVDTLVNNVGQGISRPASQLTDDDIDSMVLVNVKSALYGTQAVLPHFIARDAGQIVNVSSMLGRVPSAPQRSAYTAAKHMLNAITASLRQELEVTHPNIVISLVSPGVVRTEFGLNARHGGIDSRTIPDSQSAEDVAEVIAWTIRTGATDVYTFAGAKERVGGYYASIGVDAAV